MRRILIILLSFMSLFTSYLSAQANLPLQERFNYSLGELRTVGAAGNWSRSSGLVNDLYVVSGNLTYSDYPISAIGNQVQITNPSTDDDKLTFSSQSTVGIKVYASFLLNVSNTTGLGSTGNYFAALGSGTSTYNTRCWIRSGSGLNTFNIGLSKYSTTVPAWSSDLNINNTYLLVLYYEFVSGSANDNAKIWINPDLSGTEPTADLSSSENSDASTIDGFFIRQSVGSSNATPNAYIDALRIGLNWGDSALPVELTSFISNVDGFKVNLFWSTATEVNNYGFEILRGVYTERSEGAQNDNWERIGFVNENGNCNSPKSYSFTDEPTGGKEFKYRLKQIDFDGAFEYSYEITAKLGNVSTYKLDQNYPNPFNPYTKISYIIPQRAYVHLRVYDMLAKEVVELVNKTQESGRYEVTFDGTNLPSGAYFYKLEAGNYIEVKKLLLVK